jgi:hypothetical protein
VDRVRIRHAHPGIEPCDIEVRDDLRTSVTHPALAIVIAEAPVDELRARRSPAPVRLVATLAAIQCGDGVGRSAVEIGDRVVLDDDERAGTRATDVA